MKSERRHELETNTLADSLARIPYYFHQYGSRILLGVILVALVLLLLYNRSASKRQEAQLAMDQLTAAREAIARLRSFDPINAHRDDPAERVKRFQDLVRITRESLDGAVERLDDPTQLSEALVARGDLNWTIANYPELPGAGEVKSAPSSEERSKALAEAKEAYQRVLSNYGDQRLATLSAHLGLAAVAENAGDWEAARKSYEAVANGEMYAQAFRDQAKARLETLDELRRPVLLVAAREPMVLAPSTTQATTQATTQPTTGVGITGNATGFTPVPPTTGPAVAPAVE
jgi:hypothetical protein